jgi:urease accessory protein
VLVRATADSPPNDQETTGRGLVRIDRCGGSSVVTRARATSPLRLLTPRNHGDAAWVYLGSYGGGLLDGDRLSVDVTVSPGARAMIATQAWTKVYRARSGSTTGACVSLHSTVGTGGQLLLLPDPVVCFASSRFEQTQRIDLAEGASLVLVDWMSAGRQAAGERWQFARYSNRMTVRYGGRLVLLDASLLTPDEGPLPERLGRINVLCQIVLIGPVLTNAAARALARAAERPVERRATLLVAASPIRDVGVQVRLAGESHEHVNAMARDVLDFVPSLLGDDPWARKW